MIWFAGLMTPTLLVYVPLSMAVVLPLVVLATGLSRLIRREPVFRFDPVGTLLILSFVVVAGFSFLWSYSPSTTLGKLSHTVPTLVVGLLTLSILMRLGPAERTWAANGLVPGVLAAMAALFVERAAGGVMLPGVLPEVDVNLFLNQFNRPLLVLSILIWPTFVVVERRWQKAGFGLLLVYLLGLFAFKIETAFLAVALGAVAGILVAISPRLFGYLFGALFAGLILLAPTLESALPPPKETYETLKLPRSAYHRLIIWRFTAGKIAERPILGWGFNTSRILPDGSTNIDVYEPALPLHPHNGALQWRVELGIPGALIGAGLFFFAMFRVARLQVTRLNRAGAAGAITAAFTVAMLSFGIWQTWWVSSLFLAAGFCIVACAPTKDPSS
ncbi:MAG: O-antigen ligase family protein [Alphaproteobacteria bacterium]|jgi:exopolysaccharide production protein ExoQ